MKKLIPIIILLTVFSQNLTYGQDLMTDFKKVILKSFNYTDLNPIYKPESEMIQKKFDKILEDFGDNNVTKNSDSNIDTLFNWIYNNAICEYDDSPDSRRMKMRRAICFASIALISDSDKAHTFTEYSKLSIIGDIESPETELLENQYLGILLIETMLKYSQDNLNQNDLTILKEYLDENLELLNEKIYFETLRLIEKCKTIVRQ